MPGAKAIHPTHSPNATPDAPMIDKAETNSNKTQPLPKQGSFAGLVCLVPVRFRFVCTVAPLLGC